MDPMQLDDKFNAEAAVDDLLRKVKTNIPSPTKPAAPTAPPRVKTVDPDAELAEAIKTGARELGIDPEDYATIMSYESAGSFDPWKKGPVTKWGQHRGTIQYGEPQRRDFGVYKGQSAAEQITKSNVKYLKAHGVKPGMSMEQVYAAINGGRTDRPLSTPDVGTGRTIADNIRKANAEHRPLVRQRFGRFFGSDAFDPNAAVDDLLSTIAGKLPPTDAAPVMQPKTTAPVTERPETLIAQRQAARDPQSSRIGVLYTDPATVPELEVGEYDIPLSNNQVLRTDAAKLMTYLQQTGTKIGDIANGTADFTPLIGGKAEPTGEQYGTQGQVAVISYDENGVELIADAITDPASIPVTAALHKKQFPNRKITTTIVTGDDVIAGRQETEQSVEPTVPPEMQATGEGVPAGTAAGQDTWVEQPEAAALPADDAAFEQANAYLRSQNQPLLTREQFDAAQSAFGSDASATGYSLETPRTAAQEPVLGVRSDTKAPAVSREPNLVRATRNLTDKQLMGTDVSYVVDLTQATGDKQQFAAEQARQRLMEDFGLTSDQAALFVPKSKKPYTDADQQVRIRINRGELADILGVDRVKQDYAGEISAYEITDEGLESGIAAREARDERNVIPAVDKAIDRSMRKTVDLSEGEAEKRVEETVASLKYAGQQKLAEFISNPLNLFVPYALYNLPDTETPPSAEWAAGEKQRLLSQYGSYRDAVEAENYYQQTGWAETALRGSSQLLRSFTKNVFSSTAKSAVFLSQMSEFLNPANTVIKSLAKLGIVPEGSEVGLRNAGNAADFMLRLVSSRDAGKAAAETEWVKGTDPIARQQIFRAAQEFDKAIGDDEVLKGRFFGSLADASGSALAFVALGALMPSITTGRFWGVPKDWSPALSGALQMAGPGYEEALQIPDVTEDQARTYGIIQGVLGLSEMFGAGAELSSLLKAGPMKGKLATALLQATKNVGKEALKSGWREAKQEFAQEVFQTSAGNAVREYLADRDPSTLKKLQKALNRLPMQISSAMANEGVIAMLTGGAMGGATAVAHQVGAKRAGQPEPSAVPVNPAVLGDYSEKSRSEFIAAVKADLAAKVKQGEISQATADKALERASRITNLPKGRAVAESIADLLGTSVEVQPSNDKQADAPIDPSQLVESRPNRLVPDTKTAAPGEVSEKKLADGVPAGSVTAYDKDGTEWEIVEDRGDKGFLVSDAKGVQKIWPLRKFDKQAIAEVRAQLEEVGLKSVSPARLTNTQLAFNEEQAAPIKRFRAEVIDPADLVDKKDAPKYAKDPLNIDPHVTIKYGLKTSDPNDVAHIFAGEKPVEIELGRTAVFPGAEGGNYDVVIAKVKGPDLQRMHDKVTAEADVEPDTHRNYVPHVTLAYVKKGLGRKYANRTDLEGLKFTFDGVTFSPADRRTRGLDKTVLPLQPQTVDESLVVNPIDRSAKPAEKVRQLRALTDENVPIVQEVVRHLKEDLGMPRVSANVKTDEGILTKAARPEVREKKPWHDVEHIRDSYRFRAGFNELEDIVTITKAIADAGFTFIKVDTPKFANPGKWGWRPIALDLRAPNGQILEFYMSFGDMIAENDRNGHRLFEKWRNEDMDAVNADRARALEYKRDVRESYHNYHVTFVRNLQRLGLTPAAFEAAFAKTVASLESVTRSKLESLPMSSSGPSMPGRQVPSASRTMKGGSSITNARPDERSINTSRESAEFAIDNTSNKSISESSNGVKGLESPGLKHVEPSAAGSALGVFTEPRVEKNRSAQKAIEAITKHTRGALTVPIKEATGSEVEEAFYRNALIDLQYWTKNYKDRYTSFYGDDVAAANDALQAWAQEVHGRELKPEEVELFHLLGSLSASGVEPREDSAYATIMLDRYLRTGTISAMDPMRFRPEFVKGEPTGNVVFETDPATGKSIVGTGRYSTKVHPEPFETFVRILNHFKGNLKKAMAWVNDAHSLAELLEVSGQPKLPTHEYLNPTKGGRGVFSLFVGSGAKLGSYYLNRIGNFETVTKDMWYGRGEARYLGLPLQGKDGKAIGGPVESKTVYGLRTRIAEDAAIGRLAKQFDTEPAIIQQWLWDFEQRLWEHAGMPATRPSYISEGVADGIKRLVLRSSSGPRSVATLGVGVVRQGTGKSIADTVSKFAKKTYKEALATNARILKAFNVNTSGTQHKFSTLNLHQEMSTVGVWEGTSDSMEESVLYTVSGPDDLIKAFAVTASILAPNSQQAVMLDRYDRNGEGDETHITFTDLAAVNDFIANRAKYNAGNLSLNPATQTVIIVHNQKTDEKPLGLEEIDKDYGDRITKYENRSVDTDFIDESAYRSYLQEARDSVQRHYPGKRGESISAILDEAEARLRKAKPQLFEDEEVGLKSVPPPAAAVREVNYAQIKDDAGRVLKGEQAISESDPAWERGRAAGGRTNVEASLVLRASESSIPAEQRPRYGEDTAPYEREIGRQEALLENYAKQAGVWVDHAAFIDEHPEPDAAGGEGLVYIDRDAKTVTKLVNPRAKGISPFGRPQQYLDNRISLFNTIFPESAVTLEGMTRDAQGRFLFIIKQPLIEGEHATSHAPIRALMESKGFRVDGFQDQYRNDLYKALDVGPQNALITPDGTVIVIDAIPRPDVEVGLKQVAPLENSLGIPRSEMPQIRRDDHAEFVQFAADRGVGIVEDTARAGDLLPTQNEYNPEQAAQLPERAFTKRLMVSSDNRVLDGHNTLVRLQENPDRQVDIWRVELPATEALGLMKDFPKTTYKSVEKIGPTDAPAVDDWQARVERELADVKEVRNDKGQLLAPDSAKQPFSSG